MNVLVEEFLSAREASRALGKAIDRLLAGEVEKYVIVNRNQPVAVLLSLDRYVALKETEAE